MIPYFTKLQTQIVKIFMDPHIQRDEKPYFDTIH